MTRVFISHSSKDRPFADRLVELLRLHYLDTWYSNRDIPTGQWEQEIYRGLAACDWFLVVLSPAALESEWVAREVHLALLDRRYTDRTRIVPVLAQPCDWSQLHPWLKSYQLFDFTAEFDEGAARLLAAWQVERQTIPQFRVGSVLMPVYRFVGGDGVARYRSADGVVCDAPRGQFQVPPAVEAIKDRLVARQQADAAKRGAVFVNRPQVRLQSCSWGLYGDHDRAWPLRLEVSRTDYFSMWVTNSSIDEPLADGTTIGQAFAGPLDDLIGSQLANPLATNLSVVTADRKIYVAQRGLRVGWNPGGYGPAVSGTGNPLLDCDPDGRYNPFRTAQREATEEVTGPIVPTLDQITFFGLARTFKFRFPFLFGELRLPISSTALESQAPADSWESRGLEAIPFAVPDVTAWIAARYRDQVGRRGLGPAVGTTLFSLLMSLLYEYPERWQDVVARLTWHDGQPAG